MTEKFEEKFELLSGEPKVYTAERKHRKQKYRPGYYAREVTVTVRVLDRRESWQSRFPSTVCEETLQAMLDSDAGIQAPATAGADSCTMPLPSPRGIPSSAYTGTIYVKISFTATGPSKIITEPEALAQVDVDAIVRHIVAAFNKTVAMYDDEQQHKTRVRHANAVLGHLATQARDKAKEIVRYEQRLAALRAEYEAEKQVQAKLVAEKISEEAEYKFADGDPIDQRSVDAAIAKLADVVKGGEGLFRSNDSNQLTEGDVQ